MCSCKTFPIHSDLEKAFVLLTVEAGFEKEVLNALDEISDVKEAHQIHGIYSFIIRVEAETLRELKDLILNIRKIKKIRVTLTFICTKEKRHSL